MSNKKRPNGRFLLSRKWKIMRIEQSIAFKKLQLSSPIYFKDQINVITGKNGSGKTRLLDALSLGNIVAFINDEKIEIKEIQLINPSNITPTIGTESYSEPQELATINQIIRNYNQLRGKIKDQPNPYDFSEETNQFSPRQNIRHISERSIYLQAIKTAKITGKKAEDLSEEDVRLHFETHQAKILGTQELSKIVNSYIQRKKKNDYYEYRNREKKQNVPFYSTEEFIEKFGDKPWVTFNNILNETFNGKLSINKPNEDSENYEYQAIILEGENEISTNDLSSGEKTLLWLAITLFNTQYFNGILTSPLKLLLLDEIDAFLHPKMVEKMFAVLNSFNKQFQTRIILTTHSPTTVALSPTKAIGIISDKTIDFVSKDLAISELLDGIVKLSINPENDRLVYVESHIDASIYQQLFNNLSAKNKICQEVHLNFLPAGPKISDNHIRCHAIKHLKISDGSELDAFIQAVNGDGNKTKVIGIIESISDVNKGNIRGLVDWDLENNDKQYITTLAKNLAYTLENIILDPICISLHMHLHYKHKYPLDEILKKYNIEWHETPESEQAMQDITDYFIEKIIGHKNNKDTHISYSNGIKIETDTRYLIPNGHNVEKEIFNKIPELKIFKTEKQGKTLKHEILKMMTELLCGKLIPQPFIDAFKELQS